MTLIGLFICFLLSPGGVNLLQEATGRSILPAIQIDLMMPHFEKLPPIGQFNNCQSVHVQPVEEMTNDEGLMTKEWRNPNDDEQNQLPLSSFSVDIGALSFMAGCRPVAGRAYSGQAGRSLSGWVLPRLDVHMASMILGINDKPIHFRCKDFGA
jgi:hypothetical protein